MSVTHPELASEFHPTKNQGICTSDLTAGTGRKLWWLCSECEHEWLARGYSRASGAGCPACSNKVIHIDGRNSMASTHPDLAEEFHPTRNGDLTPKDVVAGTGRKLWWICYECEHVWKKPGSRRVRGIGCPACSNKVIHIDGRNSMASTHPDLAEKFHPTRNGDLTPQDVVAGTNKELWWVCSGCENEWQGRALRREFWFVVKEWNKTSRSWCWDYTVVCSACRPSGLGEDSMASTHPDLAKQFHPTKNGDLTAWDVRAGYYKKIWWLCSECNHEWLAARRGWWGRTWFDWDERKRQTDEGPRQHGCPNCGSGRRGDYDRETYWSK